MVMKTKTLRLSDSLLKSIHHRVEIEEVDEATATRQLLRLGTQKYTVDLYKDGKLTLVEAAELLDVSIRRMLDILLEYGVKGNVTIDQQRKSIDLIKKL